MEHADSYVTNPHKWLLTTFDCSAFWVRDRAALVGALSILPEYLRNPATESGAVVDYRDWHPQLGRRFRALKLWTVLRTYGTSGLRTHIQTGVRQATRFADQVRADERLEMVTEPVLGLVVFRVVGADEATTALMEALNASGTAYLSHTKVEGRTALRMAVGSWQTTEADIDRTWQALVSQPCPAEPLDRVLGGVHHRDVAVAGAHPQLGPGILPASQRPWETGTIRSASPCTTSTGVAMSAGSKSQGATAAQVVLDGRRGAGRDRRPNHVEEPRPAAAESLLVHRGESGVGLLTGLLERLPCGTARSAARCDPTPAAAIPATSPGPRRRTAPARTPRPSPRPGRPAAPHRPTRAATRPSGPSARTARCPSASATASVSAAAEPMVRPGSGDEPPYPARSAENHRTPASSNGAGGAPMLGVPWCQHTARPSRGPVS